MTDDKPTSWPAKAEGRAECEAARPRAGEAFESWWARTYPGHLVDEAKNIGRYSYECGATERQQQILAWAEANRVRDAEYSVQGYPVHRLLKALSDPGWRWEDTA